MEWMFMPLKRYAEFSGRSRRMEFWMWMLFQILLGVAFLVGIIGLAGSAIIAGDTEQALAGGVGVIGIFLLWLLVLLAFFIPNLAVTVRRLHDTDRSGWWIMLYWGPYLASIFLTPAMVGAAANDGNLEALMGVSLLFSGVQLIGGLVLLVFLFLDGTPGPNRFGPDPKGRADAGNVFA
ncbi:DUF805 domain-containing protein [Sphingosinicella sp.]|uniref:DUF805 domain-containing protein n=1 Tax=Sphingosinicella sp. TaxID=1917971 RepID=UPI004037B982